MNWSRSASRNNHAFPNFCSSDFTPIDIGTESWVGHAAVIWSAWEREYFFWMFVGEVAPHLRGPQFSLIVLPLFQQLEVRNQNLILS